MFFFWNADGKFGIKAKNILFKQLKAVNRQRYLLKLSFYHCQNAVPGVYRLFQEDGLFDHNATDLQLRPKWSSIQVQLVAIWLELQHNKNF